MAGPSHTRPMNVCAELTLRIVRAVQEHHQPPNSMVGWFVVPDFEPMQWPEMRERLTSEAKPLVVAPLVEPGYLSLWPMSALPTEQRDAVAKHLENQQRYFAAKLQQHSLGDADAVRFGTESSDMTMSVPELLRWLGEYAIATGLSLRATDDPRVGQIVLRPPGGGRPPVKSELRLRDARPNGGIR